MNKGQRFYNIFHSKSKVSSKIIDEKNFTYRNIISIVNPYLKRSSEILDFGCGVGTISLFLASKGHHVIGLDISSKAIEVARQSARRVGLDKRAHFEIVDFSGEISVDSKFDLIICSEVLEHLSSDRKIARKMISFLKKDGYLVVSTPSLNAPLYKMKLLDQFDKKVGHIRRYNLDSLEKLFCFKQVRVVGFKNTTGILRNFLFMNKYASQLIRFLKGPLSDLVVWLDTFTIPLFGESQIFLIIKKK